MAVHVLRRLSQLQDCSISSPTDGQALVYSTTTAKWAAGTIAPGGTSPVAVSDGFVVAAGSSSALSINFASTAAGLSNGTFTVTLNNSTGLLGNGTWSISNTGLTSGVKVPNPTQALSISSGTATWNINSGPVATLAMETTAATTLAVTNASAGDTYALLVTQGTAAQTLNFAAASNFKFPGGVAPALTQVAGAVDLVTLVCLGGNLYVAIQRNYA